MKHYRYSLMTIASIGYLFCGNASLSATSKIAPDPEKLVATAATSGAVVAVRRPAEAAGAASNTAAAPVGGAGTSSSGDRTIEMVLCEGFSMLKTPNAVFTAKFDADIKAFVLKQGPLDTHTLDSIKTEVTRFIQDKVFYAKLFTFRDFFF